MRPIPRPLLIWHKPHSLPYHAEDSVRGMRRAKRAGANAIDLDINVTRDGHIVVTHWPRALKRDGFTDPRGEIKPNRTIASLSLAEVRRLRTRRGRYVILTAPTMIRLAAGLGITPCFEAKGDHRLNHPAVWEQIVRASERAGWPVVVMAQPDHFDALPAAHAAGLPTMLIGGGHRPAGYTVPSDWWPHLDYVKGGRWADRGRPSRVHRLGGNVAQATAFGCSVGANGMRARRAIARLTRRKK